MTRKQTVAEAEANNRELLMRDGPRLRTGYSLWIVAVDPIAEAVCVGGLGGFGAGQDWFDLKPEHFEMPGFDEAPRLRCVDRAEGHWWYHVNPQFYLSRGLLSRWDRDGNEIEP